MFGKYSHGLTPEQEHIKNRETISLAANHLHGGGVVVLFPDYPEHEHGIWYSGVGHWKNSSPITITFASPLFFSHLSSRKPKNITTLIEQHYRKLTSFP